MDVLMTIIGYLGAIGIAIFSTPELIRCFKNKSTANVNVWLFALLMFSSACLYISGFYQLAQTLSGPNPDVTKWSFSLAVAIANVFSFLVPLIILIYKLINHTKAKKLNMTEKEYEEFLKNKNSNNGNKNIEITK